MLGNIDQRYVDEQLEHNSYRRLKMHTANQIRTFQDKIGQLQNVALITLNIAVLG